MEAANSDEKNIMGATEELDPDEQAYEFDFDDDLSEEDEELEEQFKRFSNGRKIMEAVGFAKEAVDGQGESASELIGRALREISSVSAYDKQVAELEHQLMEIENLMHDFNHELSSYISDADFDEETFYQMAENINEQTRYSGLKERIWEF